MKARVMFVVLAAIISFSCNKEKDSMDCTIEGEVVVWCTGTPVPYLPGKAGLVELYEMKVMNTGDIFTPTYSYKVPIAVTRMDASAKYWFEATLDAEGEYYVEVLEYDTSVYMFPVRQRVQFAGSQVLNPALAAISWAKPRFINPSIQPGDTFYYTQGIGSPGASPLPIATNDFPAPWIHRTWGGPDNGSMFHRVSGKISRQGILTDTVISYTVPPGDTSVVEIRW